MQTKPHFLSLLAMIFMVTLFCCVAAIAAPAQSVFLTTLASFDAANGANPDEMSLVQGTDGNFYGTTQWGGNGYSCGGAAELWHGIQNHPRWRADNAV